MLMRYLRSFEINIKPCTLHHAIFVKLKHFYLVR